MTTSHTASTTTEYRRTDVSLAKGPALVLGTVLLAAGLYFLYKENTFLPWSNFPNGHAPVQGKVFFGIFGVNGWTGMFTAVCGGLVLFGTAQHHLAKLMSAIVGLALGAAFVIALIQGNVLGMAAANTWTKAGWAVCAVILLLNVAMPRRRRVREVTTAAPAAEPVDRRAEDPYVRREPRTGAMTASDTRDRDREPVAEDRETAAEDRDAAAEDRERHVAH